MLGLHNLFQHGYHNVGMCNRLKTWLTESVAGHIAGVVVAQNLTSIERYGLILKWGVQTNCVKMHLTKSGHWAILIVTTGSDLGVAIPCSHKHVASIPLPM